MKPLLAVLVAILAAQDPIKWKIQRNERNPRTGLEEVVSVIEGEVDVQPDLAQKTFDVRNVRVQYFSDTLEGAKSEALKLSAQKGHYDVPAGLLKLGGQVRVEREDGTVLTAGAADVDFKKKDRFVFRDGVDAEFKINEDPKAAPIRLTCRTLNAIGTPGGKSLGEIEALQDVVIHGVMNGRAEADRFIWNKDEQRGLLERRPFVRVTQGASTITAPTIVLAGSSTFVLKGPKKIRFSDVRDGKPLVFTATSEGDMVYDSSTERMTMLDRCSVHTEGFSLTSDRVDLVLAKDGKGLASVLARGNVRARRGAEGTVYGDRLTYDPKDETVSVTGSPYAVVDAGRTTTRVREFRFNKKTGRTEMRSHGGRGTMIIHPEKP